MRQAAPEQPVYLDHHATTPVAPEVLEAMLPWFSERFGNAASRSHRYGWAASEAVAQARSQVADLLGARAKEIVFTSGATEANNLALKGLARVRKVGHLVSVATEHKAVLDPLRRLEKEGFTATYLPVEPDGRLSLAALDAALREDTIAVSVMHANNEIGVLQPISAIGARCRERGVCFHTDATQAVGHVPIDVDDQGIDLLSLSAHKLYGPKGVGALFVRRKPRVELEGQIDGGGHERGLRSGTLNVPGIVGLGAACALAQRTLEAEGLRLAALRDRLLDGALASVDGLTLRGAPPGAQRLPGNAHVTVAGATAEVLLYLLDSAGIAASSGSACRAGVEQASHVLLAMGASEAESRGALRLTLGYTTTDADVDAVLAALPGAVERARRATLLSAGGRR